MGSLAGLGFDAIYPKLLQNPSGNIIELSDGTALSTINAATMLQIGGVDIKDAGAWTPQLTFATAGDLSVAYSTQVGIWTERLGVLDLFFSVITSTFTHSTASGDLRLSGIPDNPAGSNYFPRGTTTIQGITKANYTQFTPFASTGLSYIRINASGSGQSSSSVVAADMPSGGSVRLIGNVSFDI